MDPVCGKSILQILLPFMPRLIIPAIFRSADFIQYALTYGGFLLLFATISDHLGPRPVFTLGMLWLTCWSIAASFSTSAVVLIVTRAMQGLGAAATVPAAIGTIGVVFQGLAQNTAMACFGAGGSIG